MSKKLAGAGLGQPHEVLDLQVVIEFCFFLGRQGAGLLPLDEFPHALAGRLGGLKVHNLPWTERGDEFNQFFVWFHGTESIGRRPVCERLFAKPRSRPDAGYPAALGFPSPATELVSNTMTPELSQ